MDGLTTENDGWTNQGFDLRTIREDSNYFSLAWNGWDNDDSGRVPTVLATGIAAGAAHTVQLYRKTDNMVDIYLDGDLVSRQELIGGVNPTQLRIGDVTGNVECSVSYDSIKIGMVPEPSSILMVMSVIMGLLAYAWRKRK